MGEKLKDRSRVEDLAKTSLRLPRHLWREAHIRAMDGGTDMQTVVAEALAKYLGMPVETPSRKKRQGRKR